MKTSINGIVGLGVVASMSLTSSAFAQSVSNSKAAELSLHRVERLVILKKIEDTFQSQMKSLKLEIVPHSAPADISFKSTVSQFSGVDGTQKAVEIPMNEEGKALPQTVIQGAAASGAPAWPDKDPVTLCENSLHFVQDQAAKPDIAPFNQNLTSLSLSQGSGVGGSLFAIVEIHSSATSNVLNVKLKMDGTLESSEVTVVASEPGITPELSE